MKMRKIEELFKNIIKKIIKKLSLVLKVNKIF